MCGSHGYTLDGVYNQIADKFTAMLFDGITKEQLEGMERVVGLAIQSNKSLDEVADELGRINRNWRNVFGLLPKESVIDSIAVYTFFLVLIQTAMGIHGKLNDEAQAIHYIDNSINYYLSPEFAEQRRDLLESTTLPKSEKPSKEE